MSVIDQIREQSHQTIVDIAEKQGIEESIAKLVSDAKEKLEALAQALDDAVMNADPVMLQKAVDMVRGFLAAETADVEAVIAAVMSHIVRGEPAGEPAQGEQANPAPAETNEQTAKADEPEAKKEVVEEDHNGAIEQKPIEPTHHEAPKAEHHHPGTGGL